VYQFSEKSRQYQAQLKTFMDEHIYPNEHAYEEQLANSPSRFAALPLMDELKAKAREAGLWNLFIPPSLASFSDHGGLSNFDYAPLAELVGAGGVQLQRPRHRQHGSVHEIRHPGPAGTVVARAACR